ncbi:FKBP-type peptidylprolyl cis-trans isomerase [Planoprotostelium fungivorum]|uniref:peptidylprolyl isomerase n=1 Tax=Planoprotostelium fungivorum TaxID=1890364 RepID=A0A2P6NV03_9EUKA|nr:FKBP-type peptidylprolyl cis-trans isomerase [Planoprotostelium fungivorum]
MSDNDSQGSLDSQELSTTFQKFWSAIVLPGAPFTLQPPLDVVLARASLAADAKSTERSVLQVQTDAEEAPVTLAHLVLNRKETTNMNLVFSSEEEVVFTVTGKNAVHLTGYYELPENFNEDFDKHDHANCDHDHEEEEVPVQKAEPTSAKKRKAEASPAKAVAQAPEVKKKKVDTPAAASAPATPAKKEVKTPAKKEAASPATPAATPSKKAEKKAASPGAKVTTLPNGLVIEDTVLGNGPMPQPGKKVSVKYAGFLLNGKKFDSSLDKPFTFKFATGNVIQGWDIGLKGMRVGGKRKLTIPSKLAYGSKGAGRDIPPNSDLIFNVELVSEHRWDVFRPRRGHERSVVCAVWTVSVGSVGLVIVVGMSVSSFLGVTHSVIFVCFRVSGASSFHREDKITANPRKEQRTHRQQCYCTEKKRETFRHLNSRRRAFSSASFFLRFKSCNWVV